MSSAISIAGPVSRSFADAALKVAVRFWWVVAAIGQSLFAFKIASLYGLSLVRGDLRIWNKFMAHGYVPGDRAGNVAVALHLASAFLIILGGTIQLIPQIRNRFRAFHRWNGRLYMLTAFTISLAGLYMMLVRGTVGDLWQHLGSGLMAVLILFSAVMALRYAMVRDFKTHRRWALRLYLVVSASLFIRAGVFLSLLLNRGPFGFDPVTFQGPFLTFISFAQYLVPLAILEIYFRVQERAAAPGKLAMATGLSVLTVALGTGIFAITMASWLPNIKQAYDSRQSIVEILSATISSSGIEQAVAQYQGFKVSASTTYNLDEGELNTLGYQLLRSKRFKEAIRIFQLNVEAYPQSSNGFDSLAEAYMDEGDNAEAVANYEKSLQLNPRNGNAELMLKKLGAR